MCYLLVRVMQINGFLSFITVVPNEDTWDTVNTVQLVIKLSCNDRLPQSKELV